MPPSWGQATTGPSAGQVVKIADARLKFEINATDRDGGVQLFLDAEQWKRMSIFDPKGRQIFTTATKGIMAKQGGTELFLESAEPTFDELPLDQLFAALAGRAVRVPRRRARRGDPGGRGTTHP